MDSQELAEYQEKISDLAEKLLDEAIDNGYSFSEGLCDWAFNEAQRQVNY